MLPAYPSYGAMSSSSRTPGIIRHVTRSTTVELCNVHFDDNSWSHAKLPDRNGGLGLHTANDIALPDFLSTRAVSNSFVNDILHQPTYTPEDKEEVRAWIDQYLYLPSDSHKLRNWGGIQCSSAVDTLVPLLNQHRLDCFKTASRHVSGAWLKCILNNKVDTFTDNDSLRNGVALCVGLSVCIPYRCKFGMNVHDSSLTFCLAASAHASPFHHKRRRSSRPFCCQDTIHARAVW